MTSARRRRSARHKLKQHDLGHDRHNKALQWIRKRRRLQTERNRLNQAKHW